MKRSTIKKTKHRKELKLLSSTKIQKKMKIKWKNNALQPEDILEQKDKTKTRAKVRLTDKT